MSLAGGLRRIVVTKEILRLLKAYDPVLTRFGITVDKPRFVEEVTRLFQAKEE